jgi:putative peptidoglycan lipid II flippase
VASVTAFVATPFLLAIVAPGFAKAQNIFASNMTRVLFFMALAVGVARVLAMVLYADKKFLAGSVSEVVFQATTMSYLVAFHDWGVSVLAWGMVTGGFAQLFVVGVGLWDRKKDIRFSFDLRGPEVRKTVRLTLPVYVGASGAKLNNIVRRAFASLLPAGVISSLQYAFMLVEAPVSIGATSLVKVLFPYLSHEFAGQDTRAAGRKLTQALVSISVLFMPLSLGMLLLATPLVRLLFERGSFDAQSTALTASALRIYSLGILAMALNKILVMAFYARQNTTTPMKLGLVRVTSNIALCALLVPSLGYRGVALATTATELLKTVLFFACLKSVLPGADVWSAVRSIGRLALAAAAMALVVSPAISHGPSDAIHSTLGQLENVVALAALGVVSFGAALWVFCREDFLFHAGLLRRGLNQFKLRFGRTALEKAGS